ncbi:MAG: hypothetical protein AMJ70_00260 [Dehalococcoidia bacterium SG8_51_3]|nr:MAG: hypothetical protein AMJ70_00260 [Dehalococcoidia bacterium SG8_51_3]
MLQIVVNAAGVFGKLSSLIAPSKKALSAIVIVWSVPTLTLGARLAVVAAKAVLPGARAVKFVPTRDRTKKNLSRNLDNFDQLRP